MAESCCARRSSSSGASSRRASRAMCRTSSRLRAMGGLTAGDEAPALLLDRRLPLGPEPVEDGGHDPLLLRRGDDVDLAPVEEHPAAGEAHVHVEPPQPDLVHGHAALGAVHVVQRPEALPLRLVGLALHLQGQAPLHLHVLPGEVLVLGVGGLLRPVLEHRYSLSWPSAFRAATASSPSGWAARYFW